MSARPSRWTVSLAMIAERRIIAADGADGRETAYAARGSAQDVEQAVRALRSKWRAA